MKPHPKDLGSYLTDSRNGIGNTKLCLFPWIHLHLRPDGQVLPCCAGNHSEWNLGNVKEKSLREIWNSNELRSLRLNMLRGEEHSFCQNCYQLESGGATSFRHFGLDRFRHLGEKLLETKEDGRLEEFNISYIDFRTSNICQLKCRSCSSYSSSAWIEDDLLLGRNPAFEKSLNLLDDSENLKQECLDLILSSESLYFAGGEPLLFSEHKEVLRKLVESKRFNTELVYNTNFMQVDEEYFNLWSNFSNITIQISLDGGGKQGEFLRYGLKWDQLINNLENLKAQAPQIKINFSSVFQLSNAFHLKDFLKEMRGLGFYKDNNFYFNFLQNPEHLSLRVFPKEWKDRVWLYWQDDLDLLGYQADAFKSFLYSKDDSHLLKKFIGYNKALDNIRGENFLEVFPELSDLFKSHNV